MDESHRTAMNRIAITLLFGFVSTCFSVEVEKAFPERVRHFLDSPWTELSITTALVTDYKIVYATSVHLRREGPKVVVESKLPLTPPVILKTTVSKADLNTLYNDTLAAAKSTHEHRYPMEILSALPHEEAAEMIRTGKMRISANDVGMLVIRGKSPKGEVNFTETGPYSPLDTTIQKLFHTKRVELKQSDNQSILGRNPYKKE